MPALADLRTLRAAYRASLRLASVADAHPGVKALLGRAYDAPDVPCPHHPIFSLVLEEFLGSSRAYVPVDGRPLRVADMLRVGYRMSLSPEDPRIAVPPDNEALGVDAALAALRLLNRAVRRGELLRIVPPSSARPCGAFADASSTWALLAPGRGHAARPSAASPSRAAPPPLALRRAPAPAPGILLVSHPGLADPGFKRKVVLITASDGRGFTGVVLNTAKRGTRRLTLGEVCSAAKTRAWLRRVLNDKPLAFNMRTHPSPADARGGGAVTPPLAPSHGDGGEPGGSILRLVVPPSLAGAAVVLVAARAASAGFSFAPPPPPGVVSAPPPVSAGGEAAGGEPWWPPRGTIESASTSSGDDESDAETGSDSDGAEFGVPYALGVRGGGGGGDTFASIVDALSISPDGDDDEALLKRDRQPGSSSSSSDDDGLPSSDEEDAHVDDQDDPEDDSSSDEEQGPTRAPSGDHSRAGGRAAARGAKRLAAKSGGALGGDGWRGLGRGANERSAATDGAASELAPAAGWLTRDGGPVSGFTLLHPFPGVEGAAEVAHGLFSGGDPASVAAAAASAAAAAEPSPAEAPPALHPPPSPAAFCGEACWYAGQLEAEIARGQWILASPDAATLHQLALGGTGGAGGAAAAAVAEGAAAAAPAAGGRRLRWRGFQAWNASHSERGRRDRRARRAAGVASGAVELHSPSGRLWADAMASLGGEMAGLAMLPRGTWRPADERSGGSGRVRVFLHRRAP